MQTMQSSPTTGSRQLATTQSGFQEFPFEISAPIEGSTELVSRETRETDENRAILVRDVEPADALHLSLLITSDMVATNGLIEHGLTDLGTPTSVDFDSLLETSLFDPDQYINGIVGPNSFIPTIPESTMSLLLPTTNPNLMPNTSRALYRDSLPTISACINQTMSLLPLRAQNELQTSTPESVILKQILFLLMNNFAVDDDPAFTKLFEQIKHFSTAQLEYVLNAVPEPYSLALQQSFLILAIKADVPSIVELLLDHGLQVGQLKSANNNDPLTLACKLRRPRIVEILLKLDVDFSPILEVIIANTSLMKKPLEEESDSRHKIHQTLELLLKAGAKVSLRTLCMACFSQDTTILDLYIKFSEVSAVSDDNSHLLEQAFVNIMCVGDVDRIGYAIQRTLGEGFQIAQVKYERTRNFLQRALHWASLKGNISLVDFFLERGLVLDTYCLCQAIRGNNEQLGHRYIRDGLDIAETWDISPDDTIHYLHDPRPFAGELPSGVDPLLNEGIYVLYRITSPLAEAVRWGREGFLRIFEEMGVWNKIHNQRQLDCLFLAAAETGDMKLMKLLIGQPFKNIPAGCCTLAALGGHRDIVALLMDTNVETGESLITTAVATRDPELVRFILEVPTVSQMSLTALFFAVRWADFSILKDLVKAGAYLSIHQWDCRDWRPRTFRRDEQISPLKEAIALGNIEAARFLLDSGADINDKNHYQFYLDGDEYREDESALSTAVKLSHQDFVQELLNRGAEPKDAKAFELALSRSKSLFQILLDAFRRRYPLGDLNFASGVLRTAIRDEDDVTMSLLGPHFDVNSTNQAHKIDTCRHIRSTLFSEAVRSRNINIIRTLLSCGGDPNSPTPCPDKLEIEGRWTPFFDAIVTGDVLVVKLLHEAGANLNDKAELGALRTPLQLAVEKRHTEVIDYLLDNGADVNAAPCIRGGATAIQLAAIKGNVGLAERLISDYGADFNAPACRFQGRTAFEGAAEHGRLDVLLMLYHKEVDLLSDGGTQVQRATKFAEKNGQVAAKALVEQIWQKVNMRVAPLPLPSFEDPFI
jgi:ankyrin repeat protein